MKEIWKPVKGYETFYEVSNKGRVRSLDRIVSNSGIFGKNKTFKKKGRILSPRTSPSRGLLTGYLRVWLTDGVKGFNKCIHKLVAEAFIIAAPYIVENQQLQEASKNSAEIIKLGTEYVKDVLTTATTKKGE